MDLLRRRWPPTHVNLSQGEPKCPTPQGGCKGPRVETANLVGYQVYHRRRLGSGFTVEPGCRDRRLQCLR